MNYARILIGGLVAGLILNAGEFVLNGQILARDMEEFFRRCGFTPPAGSAFAILILMTFLMGILILFVYASIRPRCGPGPKTAIYAGLIAWFCVYFYNNMVAFALGLIPSRLLIIVLGWGLAEYLIAAVAGAALYKEP